MEYTIKPEELSISSWDTKKKRGGWSMQTPNGVKIAHLPTGTVVTCEEHRSQHKNRHFAILELQEKIKATQPVPTAD